MERISEDILKALRQHDIDFLPLARRSGYVCPICDNGTGQTGDGLSLDKSKSDWQERPHWKCFKCGEYHDAIGWWARSQGLDPTRDFRETVTSLAEHYGLYIENVTAQREIIKTVRKDTQKAVTEVVKSQQPSESTSNPKVKPTVLPVLPERIPESLKALTQWVLWRLELKKGRWTKVPKQVDGVNASTTKASTWTSFDEVLRAYQSGGFDGIGFVIASGKGIVGIDIDHCITDGKLSTEAQRIIDMLGSYTELSPSGSGLHVLVKANLGESVKSKAVEVYHSGRYLTITGHTDSNRTDLASVRENQTGLDKVVEIARTLREAEREGEIVRTDRVEDAQKALYAHENANPDKLPSDDFNDVLEGRRGHSEDDGLDDPRVVDYLTSRGLTVASVRRFGGRFMANWQPPTAPNAPVSPRLIIPTGSNSYLARDIRPNGNPSFAKQKVGVVQIFNLAALDVAANTGRPVYVTEGEFDAISCEQVGFHAIGLGGVAQVRKLVEILRTLKEQGKVIPTLVLALDNDDAGAKATQELSVALSALRISFLKAKYDGKDPNDALVHDSKKFVQDMSAALKVRQDEYMKFSAKSSLDGLRKEIEINRKMPRIPTGYPALDSDIMLCGGLRTGLYIFGAISSLGKTSFMLQMADQIAAQGQNVLFFSLEMSRNELMAKSISRLTASIAQDVTLAKTTFGVLDGRIYNESEQQIVDDAFAEYEAKYSEHLYIFEGNGRLGIMQIVEAVQNHIQCTGKRPVVIIDYLQIIEPEDFRMTDKQATDHAVVDLKQMSRNLGIPVIAISSFNRENYYNPLSMTAFKESGAIEYSADVLIGMQYAGMNYQDGENEKKHVARVRKLFDWNSDNAREGKSVAVQVKILKNRNGARGSMTINYFPRWNLFALGSCKLDDVTDLKQTELVKSGQELSATPWEATPETYASFISPKPESVTLPVSAPVSEPATQIIRRTFGEKGLNVTFGGKCGMYAGMTIALTAQQSSKFIANGSDPESLYSLIERVQPVAVSEPGEEEIGRDIYACEPLDDGGLIILRDSCSRLNYFPYPAKVILTGQELADLREGKMTWSEFDISLDSKPDASLVLQEIYNRSGVRL